MGEEDALGSQLVDPVADAAVELVQDGRRVDAIELYRREKIGVVQEHPDRGAFFDAAVRLL